MSATSNSLIISSLLHITIAVPLVLAMPNFLEGPLVEERSAIKATVIRPHLAEHHKPVNQPLKIEKIEKIIVAEQSIKKALPAVAPKRVVVKEPAPVIPVFKQQPQLVATPVKAKPIIKKELAKGYIINSQQVNDKKWINAAENRYRNSLIAAINKQKRYPKRARRLGFEGEVVVGFTVKADGKIINIALIESSEYNPLDRAALKVVEKVGRLEPIPTLLGREQWAFQVPLQYSLN